MHIIGCSGAIAALALTTTFGCGARDTQPDRSLQSDGAAGNANAHANDGEDAGTSVLDLPPTENAALEAWLDSKAYDRYFCEPAVHASRSPSPHGFNRICSNDVIAERVEASGEWPEGAAAVKEIFASESDPEPSGYAVYVKTRAESDGGRGWYWYERLPGRSANSGFGATVCTGCHSNAGASAATTPSPGARDYVFTPVGAGTSRRPANP